MPKNPHSVLDYVDVMDEELSRLSLAYASDGHQNLAAELSNLKVVCTHIRGLVERGTGEWAPLRREERERRDTPKSDDTISLPPARVIEKRRKPPDGDR